MRSLILLVVISILSTGCAKQFVTITERPKVQSVDVLGTHTVVYLTDARIIRLNHSDMLVISDKHPQGIVKRYFNYAHDTVLKEISINDCKCNTRQLLDCYLTEDELNIKYAERVMDNFYSSGRVK